MKIWRWLGEGIPYILDEEQAEEWIQELYGLRLHTGDSKIFHMCQPGRKISLELIAIHKAKIFWLQ